MSHDDYGLLLKAFEAGKSLFNAQKFSEARTKFDDILARLSLENLCREGVPGCDANFDTLPSSVELHVLLADCLFQEADQIRKRGLNQPITKIYSDDEESDDDSDEEEVVSSRKRRRMALPPQRKFTSAESINADVIRFKELLHEALREVEKGLSLSAECSSSSSSSFSSSSSSVRGLLVLGAEILLKLSSLGPAISSPEEVASLRQQALSLIDKLEDLKIESRASIDDKPVSKNDIRLSYYNQFFDQRREWKVLYHLHHERYSKLVKAHPSLPLVRNRKRTLFLAGVSSPHSLDDDHKDASITLLSSTSRPQYAFPDIDEALNFALPDVFEEALDPENLDRISTLILLPRRRVEEEEEEEVEVFSGEKGKNLHEEVKLEDEEVAETEEGGTSSEDAKTQEQDDDEEDEELKALEEGVADLCTKYNITDSLEENKNNNNKKNLRHSLDHVCFYNQRFYRLQRLSERNFVVQLLFCDLCAVEENVDAIFFLHGFMPKPLDDTTDLTMGGGGGEEEEKESNLGVDIKVVIPDLLDDWGFADLNLDDDKAVYGTLFPAIQSVF